MQFYRNMWIRDYLYPVCDWPGPNCRIVCHRDSTYRTLDQKTQCFARAVKKFKAKEYFIKLDDDALVDKDYIIDLVKKLSGYKRPAYISDHRIFRDPWNLQSLDRVPYGNGKFYMFNRQLVKCLNTSMTYIGPRNEDAVFGGMVSTGCGTSNVAYIRENDAWIWHKEYASKNKHIDLAFIKNH
ncbi:hypothetical protein H4R23_004107 [Coemansia sp. Cherry 401B]|nr:hypothetical protein IWW52_004216 [Coemansia sp. RSA 2704]KAJ2725767.1 hypothetical protein H4R23_004107 [Coemansia sp. Cherry 401B]